MLPYEVIKYNIGEYLYFESLDKTNPDIFWHYAEKNPVEVCDYLCSIRDEERLIGTLKKYDIPLLGYFKHCWMTSGANAGFMTELFGWAYPSKKTPLDVIVEFLNLDLASTLDQRHLMHLLRTFPKNTDHRYNPSYAMKILPFIEKHVRYNHHEALLLYRELNSDNKLRIINDLRAEAISYVDLLAYLTYEELVIFIETSETLSRDVALRCISTLIDYATHDYCEMLLEPSRYPSYKYIEMIRKKVSPEEHLAHLQMPNSTQAKYNIFSVEAKFWLRLQ